VSEVVIRGDGVGARCSIHLFQRAGIHVSAEQATRPKLPAIMLSESTQSLLKDVFGRPDLFAGLLPVRRRVVAWGNRAEPVVVPHSAVVAAEQDLLERLVPQLPPSLNEADQPRWSIVGTRGPDEAGTEHHFGDRRASASRVQLKAEAYPDACWIESLPQGWLFLLPIAEGLAWLLSVGGLPEELLADSRLVAQQISDSTKIGGEFASHPRVTDPFCGPGWIACGNAALGFDPLCGDGAGHAAREAILAAAVIKAALEGADSAVVLAHYRSRLISGMQRHIEACLSFYEQGRSGPWWDRQLELTRQGLAWCREQLRVSPAYRYRLNEFSLEPIA